MTDDEEVEATKGLIAHWRARHEAFFDAVKNIAVKSVNDAIIPEFDRHGHLVDLDIDPTAMGDYTNTELEELLLTVIRQAREDYYAQLMEQVARYLSPGLPEFEPDAAGVPYVPLPEGDPYTQAPAATTPGA